MGVYGKDGHKWTERVYKPYSFGVLPKLIQETTLHILKVVMLVQTPYKKMKNGGTDE